MLSPHRERTRREFDRANVIKFRPMAAPRVFWISASIALLTVAASALYFLLPLITASRTEA